MLQRFRKFIDKNCLASSGSKILLAVSGGIDSMVMTHLFLRSDYSIGIAHCNFSLRGDESDLDEKLVSDFAAEHGIEFFSVRFETKKYAVKHKLSVQMAARELRYDWFRKIRNEHSYSSVAVAHNLNDNVETFLINLTRGTGIAGLTGMKPSSNEIIRPLLFATRTEIVSYCKSHSVKYREDRSNSDTKYQRNKIRHQLVPLLKEMNPSIEYTLNETALRFAGVNEITSEYIIALRNQISEKKKTGISFNIDQLKPYLHNRFVLYELFSPFGIGDVTSQDLVNVIGGRTGGRLITGTHVILKNRQEILISVHHEEDFPATIIHDPSDFDTLTGISSACIKKITLTFRIPAGPETLCMDADLLSYPLILRKWKSGDFFYPLGMKHRKKLSDYFSDKKYSLTDKGNALILESEGKIVCILGEKVDNRFRITESSVNALIITSKEL